MYLHVGRPRKTPPACKGLKKATIATQVTTRSSGSSYSNCVELQNGCLTLGHSNTFIPSNFTTGKLDTEKYIRNMEIVMDTYIARVNHSPCGDGVCIKEQILLNYKKDANFF